MLTLRAFGCLDIWDDHGASLSTLLAQPKRAALLAYLVLSHAGALHRRDALLALFWPDLDQSHGRNALSQALSFLRREVGPGVIRRRGAVEVGVVPGAVLSDVQTFLEALSRRDWPGALQAYGGDLLEGLHVAGSAPFTEWVDRERARLRSAASSAAWRQARRRLSAGDVSEAEALAHRALDLVPTDEVRVRRFILALTRAGDRAAAVRFYDDFCARLRGELELEPAAPTREVAAKVRKGELTPADWNSDPALADTGEHKSVTVLAPDLSPPPRPAPAIDHQRGAWLWRLAAVALSAATLLYAATGLRHAAGTRGPPPDRPYSVLADVEGGAAGTDREAVGFLVRSGLDGAHVLRIVPAAEVRRTLDLMERAQDVVVDEAVARQVATRLGVGAVVLPRLDRFGDRYVLSLRVESAPQGVFLASAQGRAGGRDEVVEMVDEAIQEVRRQLGERQAALAASEPLPRVLTPSLEALEHYRIGRELISQGHARMAVPHLRQAVALDTAFAMAWLALAAAYGNYLDMPDSSAYAARKVRQFRDRLTQARRADQDMHQRIDGDVALWDLALSEAERAVLRDPEWIGNYAQRVATVAGYPDSALDMSLRIRAQRVSDARWFEPDATYTESCYVNPLYWAVGLDRVHELRAFFDSLEVVLPGDCDRELALYESLAAADWSRADSLRAVGQQAWRWPRVVDVVLRQLEPLHGRIEEAYRRPEPPSAEKNTASHGSWTQVSRLLLEVVYGVPASDSLPERAPPVLEGRGRVQVTGYVLYGVREALVGDTVASQRVVARLRAMRDTGTSRTFERAFSPWFILMDVGPVWRRGDWRSVIARLEPLAARIGNPGVGFVAGDQYLVGWLLADAYVHEGDLTSAIAHLEVLLQRPTARPQDWTLQGFVHPAVRFALGGLYTRVGAKTHAEKEYRAFLETFTDPDPDFAWMVDEARRGLEAVGGP